MPNPIHRAPAHRKGLVANGYSLIQAPVKAKVRALPRVKRTRDGYWPG